MERIGAPRDRRYSRRQLNQLLEVSAIQRQFAHLLLGSVHADRGIGRFHRGDLALDRHGLLLLADLQGEIDDVLRADRQRDAGVDGGLESHFGSLHFVLAHSQVGNSKSSLRIRRDGLRSARRGILHLYARTGNRGARNVSDGT